MICSPSAWSFVRFSIMADHWFCLKTLHRLISNKLKWWVCCLQARNVFIKNNNYTARRCISNDTSKNPHSTSRSNNSSRFEATRTTTDSSVIAIDQVLQVCLVHVSIAHKNSHASYFSNHINSDPAVHALQFLDVINMKDPTQKAHFYRSTLKDALPFIPRVSPWQ